MNIEEFRNYCLSKKNVTESFPFNETTLVFKVAGKIFALSSLEHYPSAINLKCNPEKALELREQFLDIVEGFHMSKKHWNTVIIDGGLKTDFIKEMVDNSYDLVVKGMTKKQQKEFGFI